MDSKAAELTEITVIIPCYNSATTIETAVKSALVQSEPVKVIVVDDASKDDSVEIVRQLAECEPRLSLLVQPRNQGPSAARNRAIAHAGTPWVAILDGDDHMHPDRLRRMFQVAKAENLDIVADDLIRVDAEPNPETGTRLWSDNPIGLVRIDAARFARENIDRYTGSRRELGYLKPLMRTEFLSRHHISYNEGMRLAEDYDLYMRALLFGARFGLIDPCGYYSIDYPNSLSKQYSSTDLRKVLDRDIELLRQPTLSRDERKAIGEHKTLAHKHWAWMQLIEMVRNRNLTGAVRTLVAPPDVAIALILRICRHAMGLEPVPHSIGNTATRLRIEAMLSTSG